MTPARTLAGIVALFAVLYAVVASLADTPRIFNDELIYMEAAASLAAGDGLEVRGEPYQYGAVYPTVVAPLVALAPDREVAYALIKILNALLFALTAVPAYLLARRLLEPGRSLAVGALAILVPSSVYVTVVMTESLAYLIFTSALLAITLALERPTVWRQLAAVAVVVVAILTRAQFLLLYAAFLAALVSAQALLPARRELGLRRGLRMLWPAWASLVAGLALFIVVPLVRGADPEDALGSYESLVRTYDVWNLAQWIVWHASALELYLAVVAVAIAPVALAAFWSRARAGSDRFAAFLATFVMVNLAALLVTAIVVTFQDLPGFEIDRLHDRYLFYVVPLWLIVLVWWVDQGSPRPRTAARVGAGIALALAVLFPYWQLDLENGVKLFSAVGTALPAAIEVLVGSPLAAAIVIVAAVAALLARVLRSEGGATRLIFGVLVAVFVLNAVLVWGRAFNPPERDVFAGGLERRWIDERVPDGATVTMLDSSCEDSILERDSYFLTEFFNGSVEDVLWLKGDDPDARIEANGRVVLEDGTPLEAEYVVVQPGVRMEGTELGSGTAPGLTLWRVGGPVQIDVTALGREPEGFCLPLRV